ncbi:phage holin family protein [bacterium]|nr:MAG: phage holin family protein [bacterium]
MRKLLIRWVVLAVSVIVASIVCTALGLDFHVAFLDKTTVGDKAAQFLMLLIGVGLLSFLNATLGKVLRIATLPISCLTLGLFSLVVNAVVLWIAASFDLGFTIKEGGLRGFGSAFVASLLISFVNGVLGVFVPDDKDD